MRVTSFDRRPTGIQDAGDLPWGGHLGVFYAAKPELLGVLVPFVRAGLENNELCSWEVEPLTLEEARQALAGAVPNLEEYEKRGQVEFILSQQAPASGAVESLEGRLDRAILAGFDGLRLVRHADAGKKAGAPAALDPRMGRLNVVAAFLYSRAGLAAADLVEVVQAHRFAIVCNAGRWEVLAGSEARTAQDALARSQEKLQSLFANMSEGFALHRIVLDRQGRPCDYVFLEMNPAFERLTGLAAEKTIGRRVTQVLAGIEKDPTDWIGKYGRVALTGAPMQFESYAEPLGRWYAVSAFSPHKGYFVVTFSDITDRKKAEAQRQEAEERLLVTLRSIGDAVISTDIEGRVVMLNRVAEQLTGYAQAEAAGSPLREIFNIINEDSGKPAEDPVRKVFETGAIVGLANHTALIRRDGTRLSIADSAAPVRSEAGDLVGAVLAFRDVTEERRAERALAESEAKYRTLARLYEVLSRVNESIVRTRDERSLLNQVCQIVAEVGEFPLAWIGMVNKRDIVPVASWGPDRDYLGKIRVEVDGELGAGPTGRSVREDRVVINDDFDVNPLTAPWRSPALEHGFRASAAIPLHRQGKPVGALTLYARGPRAFGGEQARLLEALCADVSYAMDAIAHEQLRAQAEAELRDANLLLAEADRRKNEFLAVLSHELRNPLAPIANSLYVLDHAEPGGDKAKRAKQTIDRQVAQLSGLVNDLLDVTRIARNKVHLQKERLELNDLVRRSVEDSRSFFERAGIRLELAEAPRPVVMLADGIRVAQVVGNLLQNAAKFTLRGGHTLVSISCEGHEAIVRVRDDGVGISSENLARLFQPFMQAEHTLDRSKGGLGLGLALVKGLVELHGGTVGAHSDGLGKGSEFIVRFPLASEAAPEESGKPIRPAVSGRRVLIIEDNVDAADSLREALELADHRVEVAYNGPDGLAKARAFRPEVVFCDIGLPGMDGFEVARAFRADPMLKRTRLVALSGYALPEDVERAQQAGFDTHLAKPPSIEKLYGMLAAMRGPGPGDP